MYRAFESNAKPKRYPPAPRSLWPIPRPCPYGYACGLTLMLGRLLMVLRVCSQQKGVTSTGIALEFRQESEESGCVAGGRKEGRRRVLTHQ